MGRGDLSASSGVWFFNATAASVEAAQHEWCRSAWQAARCCEGNQNLCPTIAFAGRANFDGAMREEVVWPERLLPPYPTRWATTPGALLEPLGVAIHTVELAHVRPGHDVLVVGAGPLGVLAAQAARRAGARRVMVSEPLEHRRRTAPRVGADDAWSPGMIIGALAEVTEGRGADVVIEAAGWTRPSLWGCSVLGRAPGSPWQGFRPLQPPASPAAAARRKGLTFVMIRRMNDTYKRAIELATTGIDLDSLVTARFPLRQAPEAFAYAAGRNGDKTVVTPRL